MLLIADEVATGFGRTGTMFACEQEGVAPDFLCLGKGLTGGYLPLAATLTTERVYEGFLGGPEEHRTFFHGHTYTGNPLACAAALASLDVFERERHAVAAAAQDPPARRAAGAGRGDAARSPRSAAAASWSGIDLGEHDPALRLGHRVTLEARERGAIVRPLGDTVVLDAAARDLEARPRPARRDHGRVDPRRLRVGGAHRGTDATPSRGLIGRTRPTRAGPFGRSCR